MVTVCISGVTATTRFICPALCQKKRGHRSGEFLDAYDKCLHIIKPEDKDLRFALDHYLMNFFWRKYPARILRENAPKFAKAMANMPEWKNVIKEYGIFQRLQLSITRKGKFRMAKPVMKFNKWQQKEKRFDWKPYSVVSCAGTPHFQENAIAA